MKQSYQIFVLGLFLLYIFFNGWAYLTGEPHTPSVWDAERVTHNHLPDWPSKETY